MKFDELQLGKRYIWKSNDPNFTEFNYGLITDLSDDLIEDFERLGWVNSDNEAIMPQNEPFTLITHHGLAGGNPVVKYDKMVSELTIIGVEEDEGVEFEEVQ